VVTRVSGALGTVLVVSLSLSLAGCGWGLLSPVSPDYGANRVWLPLAQVPASDTASQVASAIPALSGVEVVEVIGDGSQSIERDPKSLVVVSVVPEVRVGASSIGAVVSTESLGSHVVIMSQGPNTFATAGIRKSSRGWEWTPDAVTASWWAWTTADVPGGFDPSAAGVAFVPVTTELAWLVLPGEGEPQVFPMAHMGPVSVMPPGSKEWESIAIRPYPLAYAGSSIRH
jgi:hypothetical protein